MSQFLNFQYPGRNFVTAVDLTNSVHASYSCVISNLSTSASDSVVGSDI